MSETPTEDTCQLCSQTRVLFEYEHTLEHDHGWGATRLYRLCARCWEKAETAEDAGDGLDLLYLTFQAKRYLAAMSRNSERARAEQPA